MLPDGASNVTLTARGGQSTSTGLDGNLYTFRAVIGSDASIPDHVSWNMHGTMHEVSVPVSADVGMSCG